MNKPEWKLHDTVYSCYKCERRHQGCHSTCPDYKKDTEEHLAKKASDLQKKITSRGVYEQRRDAVYKVFRRGGRK